MRILNKLNNKYANKNVEHFEEEPTHAILFYIHVARVFIPSTFMGI